MNLPKITKLFLVILFFIIVKVSFGANIFVPQMDLASKIDPNSDVETRLKCRLSLDGGYKYQAKLMFQSYNTDLEKSAPPEIVFDGAQATIKNIFNIFDMTYWTGYYGILGEGKHYKGYLYHWEELGFDYDGYRPILGTGFIFSTHFYDSYSGQLFVYRRIGSSYFNSIDTVFNLEKDPFSFNLFLGTSDDVEKEGVNFIYRIGTQLILLGDDIEFYLTLGNPSMEAGERIDFNDFYFLLEEWIKINNWNLILSIFSRPDVHYNYIQRDYINTDEGSDIDFNFDINYEPEWRYFAVGGEFNVQTNEANPFGISISPYVNIFTLGLAWKIKMDFNILSERKEFITTYVNFNASF